MSCHNKQTGNDWRWADTRHDISPYQPEECVLWPCVSCTHENTLLCQLFILIFFFFFKIKTSFIYVMMLKQIKSSLTSWACSMEGVSAGGSHALQQWQTVINTHKLSDSNYTLRLASILPHFQSIHALYPRAVTFQQRNAIEPTRAGQEVNKNWSNQTSSVCLILLVRDPGWLVEVWCVVVPVMLTFVVKVLNL